MNPFFLFESHDAARNPRALRFVEPTEVVVARRVEEVAGALARIEEAARDGLHAAGFVAYEAAGGLDPALRTHAHPSDSPTSDAPLLWFGLFRRRETVAPGAGFPDDGDTTNRSDATGESAAGGDRKQSDVATKSGDAAGYRVGPWVPSIAPSDYEEAIARIHEYILQGDTYQVNFTFRQSARFEGDAAAWYRALCRGQRSAYCAYVDTGRHVVVSVSPELFFSVEGGVIEARPMKGTAGRGRWTEEDEAARGALARCPKNRAENLMIVDLMRNDLGRIAEIGSVHVPALFDVERYETVWQMTSTVRARLRPDVGLPEMFRALFPCGSVTGAPKIRTLEIIRELETSPRGVYTGCVGYVSPGGEMLFNVAIRTVVVDREKGEATCGVGGGIVHDSVARAEFEECRIKTRFLATAPPEFSLLESLRHEATEGFLLLDGHLDRLEGSARYFGFAFDREAIRMALLDRAREWTEGCRKVRLLFDRAGRIVIEAVRIDDAGPESPEEENPAPPEEKSGATAKGFTDERGVALSTRDRAPLRVRFASRPVDSNDVFLYHKTSNREAYESRLAEHPGFDDVILTNERGEATESTRANLVAELDGRLWTPPVESGLLPGVYRAELLRRGVVAERVLRPEDLRRAARIFLVNSVREWMPVRFAAE